MSEPAYPTWMVDRQVSSGRLRVGVLAGRVIAELGGKRLALANTDILPLAQVGPRVAPALRAGGYSDLLGGQVALLPGEARVLREAALGTPEGLRLRREKLVEALARDDKATAEADTPTGLVHHNDGLDAQVSEARLALNAFDRAHPQVVAWVREERKEEPLF